MSLPGNASMPPFLQRLPPARFFALAAAVVFAIHLIGSMTSETYGSATSISSVKERLGVGRGSQTWQGGVKQSTSSAKNHGGTSTSGTGSMDDYQRANASFVILARNSDVWEIIESIRGMEDRFNHKYHYPYVFLNDEPFSEQFKKHTSGIASGKCHYGLIDAEEWAKEPEWIDQEKAKKAREDMQAANVIYGGSVSYRHMCRYQSGFFWRHKLLDQFKYYWRIEPHVKYFCSLDYDPFKFMEENKKEYGFTVSIYEYAETIPSLWDETKKFIEENPQHLAKPNSMSWVSGDGGKTYNRCHFWSNFEIGSLDFWRGDAYRAYFDHLDRAGGFFYERWGDAPVHSIAVALFLRPDQVHYFRDIGYRHEPFQHCPKNAADRCACNPDDSFEDHWYSCTAQWKALNGIH